MEGRLAEVMGRNYLWRRAIALRYNIVAIEIKAGDMLAPRHRRGGLYASFQGYGVVLILSGEGEDENIGLGTIPGILQVTIVMITIRNVGVIR